MTRTLFGGTTMPSLKLDVWLSNDEIKLAKEYTKELNEKYGEADDWESMLGGVASCAISNRLKEFVSERHAAAKVKAAAKAVVLAFAFLLLAPAAHAETMLLELAWKQPEPVTLPVQYSVHVEDSSFFPNHGGWLETVFEWPHQSWAPEETVRALNLPMIESSQGPLIIFYVVDDHISGAGQQQPERGALGCNSCHFSRMMGQPDSGFSGEYWLQYVADQGWEVDLQVPLLGDTGLKGYWLTNVERLVTADKQTIRFYGVVIPEPASWVLVLCGCFMHSVSLRRRQHFARAGK